MAQNTIKDDSSATPVPSVVEQLVEQGYDALEQMNAAPTLAQALEMSGVALALFERAQVAAQTEEERRLVKQGRAAVFSQCGHQQRYARNYKAAIADLSEALRLNPTLAEDYYYRGQSYLSLQDEGAARKDFTEYLRRGTDEYLRAMARELSSALILKSQDGGLKAGEWQQEGIRLNTEAANALHPREGQAPRLAQAVALYNKALDAFNQALTLQPKDMLTQIALITALSEQAQCYLQMEEYDLAIANYDQAYAVRPLPQYLFRRGEAYRAAGHQAEARADFAEFLQKGKERDLLLQAKKYLEEKKPELDSRG